MLSRASLCASLLLAGGLAAPGHAQLFSGIGNWFRQKPAHWPTDPAQVYSGPADQVSQMPVPAFPRLDAFQVAQDVRNAWQTPGNPVNGFQNAVRVLPGGDAAMDRFQGNFLTPGMNGPRPATVYSALEQQARNPMLPLRNEAYWNARNANEADGWDVQPSGAFAPPRGLFNKDRIAISSGIINDVQSDMRNQALGTFPAMGRDLYHGTVDWAGQKIGQGMSALVGGGNAQAGN